MVAMFGLIMPAPLLMPVKVTVGPAMLTVRAPAFGCVSMVMMASAAENQLSVVSADTACGKPATRRGTGSGSRITPVENGKICCGVQPSSSASAAQLSCAAARPDSPVPALALPVLTSSARIGAAPAVTAARLAFEICTGAAQKRFRVNTPATVAVGASFNTSKSLRLVFLMPASATPISMPATAFKSAATGLGELTAIGVLLRGKMEALL